MIVSQPSLLSQNGFQQTASCGVEGLQDRSQEIHRRPQDIGNLRRRIYPGLEFRKEPGGDKQPGAAGGQTQPSCLRKYSEHISCAAETFFWNQEQQQAERRVDHLALAEDENHGIHQHIMADLHGFFPGKTHVQHKGCQGHSQGEDKCVRRQRN